MQVKRGVWLAGLILASTVTAAPADEDREIQGEIGVLGGVVRFEVDLTEDEPEYRPVLGLRGGVTLSPHFGWYVDGLHATTKTASFRGDAQVLLVRTGIDYFVSSHRRSKRWFLSGAGGYTRIGFDGAPTFESPVVSGGFGQRIRFGGTKLLRWEVRGNIALTKDGYELFDGASGPTLNDVKVVVGLGWGLGRKPAASERNPAP